MDTTKNARPLVLLIRSLNRGGAERQVTTLAILLHRANIPVIVTTFYGDGPLQIDLEQAGVPTYCLEKKGRWDTLPFLLRLISFLRRSRPHTVYGFLAVPNILALLARPFVPEIRVVWGIRSSGMDLKRYDWLARLAYSIEAKLAGRANLIISNSHAGRKDAIARGFPDNNKFLVVPNGINIQRFTINRSNRDDIRKQWGIDNETIAIGVIGRFDPKKGHAVLFEAIAKLAPNQPTLRFLLAGTDSESRTQSLMTLVEQFNIEEQVIWLGPQDDMPTIYNAIDLLCLPSIYGEGFPNVVGEAMACGTPCIATDVGDAAWIMGDTGLSVSANNVQELATSIEMALARSDLAHPATRARTRIEENFSSEKLLENTCEALNISITPFSQNANVST